jgi:hypothetical protein
MNQGIVAIRELAMIGYRAVVMGEEIGLEYEGVANPDPAQVVPLVEMVRKHKDDVLYFLKSYCPRCGGVIFAPDCNGNNLCLSCYWVRLTEIYPDM